MIVSVQLQMACKNWQGGHPRIILGNAPINIDTVERYGHTKEFCSG